MHTIRKYKLSLIEHQVLCLPEWAKILDVQVQDGQLTLWALVNPEGELEERSIHIVGTGQPFPLRINPETYFKTVQMCPYVWHIFIEGSK